MEIGFHAACAVGEQLDAAEVGGLIERGRQGDAHASELEDSLAAEVQPLARGGEDPRTSHGPQELVDERRGPEDVLEVVQHQ